MKGGEIIANISREDSVRDRMNEPIKINTDVDIRIPKDGKIQDKSKYNYICTCCGKGYNNQKNNFQKSSSPLFQSNDGYLPFCKSCADKYYNELVDLYSGNEEHAIKHFCQQVDWVYDLDGLVASKQTDRSRLSNYSSRKNLGQTASVGSTYIDSLKYNYSKNSIQSKEDIKNMDTPVTITAIGRWGPGLEEDDYMILEDHYKMLKKNNPNCDNNQEIFIKSLCNLNWLMSKALRTGDSDKYVKLTEQYSKTFTKAGLKTVDEKDSSNDETFCMTLGFISEYTPEEFYLDKDLYKDYDKIGEYIDRHITRPMINLETGSSERDSEYFVPESDDEYEEE